MENDIFYAIGYVLGTATGLVLVFIPIVIVVCFIASLIRKHKDKDRNKGQFEKPKPRDSKTARPDPKSQKRYLLQKIRQLDSQYPLNRDFHCLEVTYNCKSRKEYERLDYETAAIEYIRSHPEEMEFYENVVLPNIQNQAKYEIAFEKEIEPYTSKSSLLKKKKRKGQIDMMGWVIITYTYQDKATRKRKEDRRSTVFKSLNRVYQDIKNGVVRQSEKQS